MGFSISYSRLILLLLGVTIAIILSVQAKPQNPHSHHHPQRRTHPHPSSNPASYGEVDNVPSATNHGHHSHGRVQIKVYRGPSKGWGWESFAPHGYWVRQPPDDHPKGWGWRRR